MTSISKTLYILYQIFPIVQGTPRYYNNLIKADGFGQGNNARNPSLKINRLDGGMWTEEVVYDKELNRIVPVSELQARSHRFNPAINEGRRMLLDSQVTSNHQVNGDVSMFEGSEISTDQMDKFVASLQNVEEDWVPLGNPHSSDRSFFLNQLVQHSTNVIAASRDYSQSSHDMIQHKVGDGIDQNARFSWNQRTTQENSRRRKAASESSVDTQSQYRKAKALKPNTRGGSSMKQEKNKVSDYTQNEPQFDPKEEIEEYNKMRMVFESSILEFDKSRKNLPLEFTVNWTDIEKYLLQSLSFSKGQAMSEGFNPTNRSKIRFEESASIPVIHRVTATGTLPQSEETSSELLALVETKKDLVLQQSRQKLWAWISAIPDITSRKEYERMRSIYSNSGWGFSDSRSLYPQVGESSKEISQMVCRLWVLNKHFIESFSEVLDKSIYFQEQISLKNWLEDQIEIHRQYTSNTSPNKGPESFFANQIWQILTYSSYPNVDEVKFVVPQKKNQQSPTFITKKTLIFNIAAVKILMHYYEANNLEKWNTCFPNFQNFVFYLANIRCNIETFLSAFPDYEKGQNHLGSSLFPWKKE